ncbi:FAD-dependent oxidoreductase [Blastococcus brunescens]|uniref:FAD-dependent oxidoreductase n=1 Tax=Blastococcus brunescens TaxID=1564165 RepID=UPI003BEF3BB6
MLFALAPTHLAGARRPQGEGPTRSGYRKCRRPHRHGHGAIPSSGFRRALLREARKVRGGADTLARRIARDLEGAPRLRWPVTSIAARGDAVVIGGPQGTVAAKAVVVALPVNVQPNFKLDVDLAPAARRAIAEGQVGRAAKRVGHAGAAGGRALARLVGCGGGLHRARRATLGHRTFGVAVPSHEAALDQSWSAVQERASRHHAGRSPPVP